MMFSFHGMVMSSDCLMFIISGTVLLILSLSTISNEKIMFKFFPNTLDMEANQTLELHREIACITFKML